MINDQLINPSLTARTAGFLYLLLVPLGLFGIMYVPSTLVVIGDVAATASNIIANELLFRLAVISAFVVQLINLILVLLLYQLLKPVNQKYAKLMVLFILAAIPIAMLNELNHIAVILLLSDTEYLTSLTSNQLQTLMSLFLNLHEYGIQIAGIFWGLWLFPMGYLIYRSNYLPKFIGILLVIGCFGYLADSFIYFVFPDFGITVSEFTCIGEVILPLWLLFKGVDIQQWNRYAVESSSK